MTYHPDMSKFTRIASRTGTLTVLVGALLSGVLPGCGSGSKDGGKCTYTDYAGTCRGTGGTEFTFTGMIGGMPATFAGNSLNDGETLALDEERACTLSYIAEGTCTPCEIGIGACGTEAIAGQP